MIPIADLNMVRNILKKEIDDRKLGKPETLRLQHTILTCTVAICERLDRLAQPGDSKEGDPPDQKPELTGNETYMGNSVSYIHTKMQCYRDQVGMAFQALRDLGFDSEKYRDNDERREGLREFVEATRSG